jgi:hypothetical protein
VITTCVLAAFLLIAPAEAAPYVCEDLPDVSGYTLKVTAYDPVLGGHNCMEPCDQTAVGYMVDDWYGRGAGCPLDLLRARAVVTFAGYTFPCIDTGGAVLIDHGREWVRVDLLWKLHDEQGAYHLPEDAPWFIHTEIPAGDYSVSGVGW